MRGWGSRALVTASARLRPLGFAGHHASPFMLRAAAPRVARRAKRGGARRDRTADLLHAMQALSQLSYGPFTVKARSLGQCSRKPWATCGGDPEHSSGPISSLFVASDITDDVSDVLIAFFLVGNEG